jgi:hypothetical protein
VAHGQVVHPTLCALEDHTSPCNVPTQYGSASTRVCLNPTGDGRVEGVEEWVAERTVPFETPLDSLLTVVRSIPLAHIFTLSTWHVPWRGL